MTDYRPTGGKYIEHVFLEPEGAQWKYKLIPTCKCTCSATFICFYKLRFLAYFPYFEKIKGALGDQLTLCVPVCLCIPLWEPPTVTRELANHRLGTSQC
jgi:hypothetical protein